MVDQAFYDGLADELLGRWNRLKSFTGHAPSIGHHHEEILRETIRAFLSPRFQLRSGFSFVKSGVVSNQGDILVVDENDPAPYLFRQGDLVVVQPRALRCVIEVKTKLDRRGFVESMANLASFQDVADLGAPNRHPATYLFAFDGPAMSTGLMDSWYKKVATPDALKNYPNAVLVLKKGLLWRKPPTATAGQGHFYIGGEELKRPKARGLSLLLASIRKHVEMHSGVNSNPYEYALFDQLKWSRQYLQFGKGLIDPGTEGAAAAEQAVEADGRTSS